MPPVEPTRDEEEYTTHSPGMKEMPIWTDGLWNITCAGDLRREIGRWVSATLLVEVALQGNPYYSHADFEAWQAQAFEAVIHWRDFQVQNRLYNFNSRRFSDHCQGSL